MDQTADALKRHIDDRRDALTENVQELETRARSMTDWKQQFEEHPEMFLGAAFGGGLLLGALFSSSGNHKQPYYYDPGNTRRNLEAEQDQDLSGRSAGLHRAGSKLDDIQGALISIAATKLEEIVRDAIPGFGHEVQRVRADEAAGQSDGRTSASSSQYNSQQS